MSILTRWEPFRELRHETRQMRHLQRAMNQLFGRWGIDLPEWPALAVSYPPVNLWEDDDFVYAEAELPGLKLPDLEITVTANNQLALKGKREPAAPERVEWHRQERGFGSLPSKNESLQNHTKRRCPLPEIVNKAAGEVTAPEATRGGIYYTPRSTSCGLTPGMSHWGAVEVADTVLLLHVGRRFASA